MSALHDTLDRIAAGAALVALAPLLGALAVAVKLTSSGPVLYEPEMLGLRGAVYRMKKLRSMVVGAPQLLSEDDKTVVAPDDERLTSIAPLIRLGFDELPQLINVLRGEMALVGPRPDPAWVAPRYTDRIRRRLDVRPGITGLSQVLDGRTQRQAVIYLFDVYYAEHRSIALDAVVIALTVPYVLGVRRLGHAIGARLIARNVDRLAELELLPPGEHPQPGNVTPESKQESTP